MAETNIYRVTFGQSRNATPMRAMYWSDIGWMLQFEDVDLPETYQVYFAHPGDEVAKRVVGNSGGALVPNEYLLSGSELLFWIYVTVDENSAHTKYTGRIPIEARPPLDDSEEEEPTPEQDGIIEQTIIAANAAVERAEELAEQAEAARDAIQDMSVEAEALPYGEGVQVEKTVDAETGAVTLTFGFPAVLPPLPEEDGTYRLRAVVSGGATTLVWTGEE